MPRSGDGTGDLIIDLPPEALAAMGIGFGDLMNIELVGGSMVLKPIRDAEKSPAR